MIIYNITIKVHHSIQDQWLQWAQGEHIADVLASNCFTHGSILKLLEVDDSEGPTYAIQFHAESKALYNLYIDKFAGAMRHKSFDKWGDKFIAFRSVMQVVN